MPEVNGFLSVFRQFPPLKPLSLSQNRSFNFCYGNGTPAHFYSQPQKNGHPKRMAAYFLYEISRIKCRFNGGVVGEVGNGHLQ
jgi:hypothetical protein